MPGNAIGWLLCLVGLTVVTSMFAEHCALMGVATDPGGLPEVKHIGGLSGGLVVLAIIQPGHPVAARLVALLLGELLDGFALDLVVGGHWASDR